MLRLNISTQPTVLSASIQEPQINLRTTLPTVQLDTEAATLEISSPKGELSIDQTPCRYSLGIKNMSDFVRDFAQEGKNAVLAGIARMANEGDQLADISKYGGDPIVSLAIAHSTPAKGELTLGWIENPIISYQPKAVTFKATDPQVNLELKRGTVENNFQWGTVSFQVTQYPKITMWTTGSIDMQV
ncbi:hypothetical protein AXX12_08615 [Anaerosporomusa subterranea]|uniref:Uncharacterized protein n=1 Tax=Anaerosporomusa subterranea TaxID=1794912 RepID=A0A154BRJ4_ANASB|nr:DUF6470 family protein [Anaerosporomusa subterranea]KYZ76485.1 hypothetical protein AXX12_08615 [Anaerosporomusa subterranea]